MIIDGRAIAGDILDEVKASLEGRPAVVRAVAIKPSTATLSYLSIKEESASRAGMKLEVVKLSEDATEEDIIAAVTAPGADAVLVQLPIPEGLDLERVLAAIPLSQDADVLSSASCARFEHGEDGALVPPVAQGVWEILTRHAIDVRGKNVVVAGRGKLVGKPCAALLAQKGGSVSVVHKGTEHPEELFKNADIIVSGVGRSHFITPDMVKDGAVLIDGGTSGTSGAVAGDFHPGCADKASLFTPVPGGVGPIAVACLFLNTARLIHERKDLA